jgi:hypothetical protein
MAVFTKVRKTECAGTQNIAYTNDNHEDWNVNLSASAKNPNAPSEEQLDSERAWRNVRHRIKE